MRLNHAFDSLKHKRNMLISLLLKRRHPEALYMHQINVMKEIVSFTDSGP